MPQKTRKINTRNRLLVCAFCKHWYDPLRTHIRPDEHDPLMIWWEYDMDIKALCSIAHQQRYSQSNCPHFEKKIP